jgi:hypothetical protein
MRRRQHVSTIEAAENELSHKDRRRRRRRQRGRLVDAKALADPGLRLARSELSARLMTTPMPAK